MDLKTSIFVGLWDVSAYDHGIAIAAALSAYRLSHAEGGNDLEQYYHDVKRIMIINLESSWITPEVVERPAPQNLLIRPAKVHDTKRRWHLRITAYERQMKGDMINA
jgi:hypothetical protein